MERGATGVTSRDTALAAVRAHIADAAAYQDMAPVLSDSALRDAEELLAGNGAVIDQDAAQAAGLFYWYRYIAPAGGDPDDLVAAARVMTPLLAEKPAFVPPSLRYLVPLLAERPQSTDVAAAAEHALRLKDSYDRTGERLPLHEAAAIFRATVIATPSGTREHITYASYLWETLERLRYCRPPDVSLFEEATREGLQAIATIPADDPSRLEWLLPLGNVLHGLVRVTGDTSSLEQLVGVHKQLLDTLADDPARIMIAATLARNLIRLGESTGEVTFLEDAVRVADDILATTETGSAEHLVSLTILSGALLTLGRQTGDRSTLERAVEIDRAAVEATPAGAPERTERLHDLASTLRALADQTGEQAFLEQAIEAQRNVAVIVSPDDPGRASYLSSLSGQLMAGYDRAGDIALLAEAAHAAEDAVSATEDADPLLATRLVEVANVLRILAERTADVTVLSRLVRYDQRSLDAVLRMGADPIAVTNSLVTDLRALGEHTGDIDILGAVTEAVRSVRDGIADTAADDPERLRRLAGLAAALRVVGKHEPAVTVLEDVVRIDQAIVAALPPDHPSHLAALKVLTDDWWVLADAAGDAATLEEAIQADRDFAYAIPANDPRRAVALGTLRASLQEIARRTGDLAMLERAVQVARETLEACPAEHPGRPRYLAMLARVLTDVYERTWDVETALQAVQAAQDAVDAAPSDHPDRAGYQHDLCSMLRTAYLRTRDSALLERAIQAGWEALETLPAGEPGREVYLDHLANALRDRAELGDSAALERAISLGREAVAATAGDDPNLATHLNNLGISLLRWYLRTEDAAALDEALQVIQNALAAPHGERDHFVLANLGTALSLKSRLTGNDALLEEAAEANRQAANATPAHHPERQMRLLNLRNTLHTLGERTGSSAAQLEATQVALQVISESPVSALNRQELLEELGVTMELLISLGYRENDVPLLRQAVDIARAALRADNGDADLTVSRLTLAKSLQALGKCADDSAVHEEAVRVIREALAAITADDSRYVILLAQLSEMLLSLYQSAGNKAVLDEAIQTGRRATEHEEHPPATALHTLQVALRNEYERTHDKAALTEAIDIGRVAVAATGASGAQEEEFIHQGERATAMSSLATSLQWMYRHAGELAYLEEAIEVGRGAVAAVPAGDSNRRFRAIALNNLGSILWMMADRTGDSALLTEAVRKHKDAVAFSPDRGMDRVKRLSNLGLALFELYERSGESAILHEAIEAGREAVAATPPGDPSLPKSLNNYATALRELFAETGNVAVLEEVVEVQRKAVAATPPDNVSHAGYLANLGSALRQLGEHTDSRATLAEAVRVGREAVAAASGEHPNTAETRYLLGISLLALGLETGDAALMAEARQCMEDMADDISAPAYLRLNGYATIASLPDLAGGSPQAKLAAIEAAVDLLPQFVPRALNRADRENRVGQLSSIASLAASAAVEADRPGRAIELLEQTRGILVADTLDARSGDLTNLRTRQPALADEFERLRDLLETLDHQDPGIISTDGDTYGSDDNLGAWWSQVQRHREAYAAWRDLITRIRAADGLHDFLAAPHIAALSAHAGNGPIVFVYVSSSRGDALILTGDVSNPVRLVPLPGLTQAIARQQVERLLWMREVTADSDASPEERIAAQQEILEVLGWTWDEITAPVLDALGLTDPLPDGQPWPHVWWCPVGFLSYLPLHAAGHHDEAVSQAGARPRNALDRVVSSYITTLRGLAYARAQRPGNDRTIIAAVPDAPGVPPLAGAASEAKRLDSLIPGARILSRPTREALLGVIPENGVAHFACHGQANWDDAAASQLILYDHQLTPLTVADIGRLRFSGSLAYLSACSTSVTSFQMANEAVHITGAFHLAGYQHVVGTLWQVNDTTAETVAVSFYQILTEDGSVPPDTRQTAIALHRVIRNVRDRYPRTPTLWTAYIHTGS